MDAERFRGGRLGRYSVGAVLAIILFLVVVLPIIVLIYTSVATTGPQTGKFSHSFSLSQFDLFTTSAFLESLRSSVIIALGGTILALVFGGGIAWVVARTDVPLKPILRIAGIVPIFLPTLIGAVAWGDLGSPRQGYINIMLHSAHIPLTFNVQSYYGMCFVLGLYYTSYAYLTIYSALTLANPEMEEAAQVHGASAWRVMGEVTLPLVAPAVLGSALLIFALTIENFPVPVILGEPGGIPALPTYIFNAMNAAPPNTAGAAIIGVGMAIVLVAILLLQRRYLAGRVTASAGGKGMRSREFRLGKWRWPVLALVLLYLFVSVVLPIFALVEEGFRTDPYVTGFLDLFNPARFGLASYRQVTSTPILVDAFKNTVLIAVGVALFGTALTLVMAFIAARPKSFGGRLVQIVSMIPVAVPSLVFGICVLWTWLLVPIPIYGTLIVLIVAFIPRFIPTAFTTVTGSLTQVHRELEESAGVYGASKTRTAFEVTLPLVRSSIVSSMLLLLILSFHEVSAAIFLYTPNTNVVAVVLFGLWENGSSNQAAVIGLFFIVILAVVVAISRKWLSAQGIRQL